MPELLSIAEIIDALAAVRLEVIFIGACAQQLRTGITPESIELLIRDTPLHRRRLSAFAAAIGCAEVPLSHQARTIALVSPQCKIDVMFGRTAHGSFGSLRAAAGTIQLGGACALIEGHK
jgi:hypothetical protein